MSTETKKPAESKACAAIASAVCPFSCLDVTQVALNPITSWPLKRITFLFRPIDDITLDFSFYTCLINFGFIRFA